MYRWGIRVLPGERLKNTVTSITCHLFFADCIRYFFQVILCELYFQRPNIVIQVPQLGCPWNVGNKIVKRSKLIVGRCLHRWAKHIITSTRKGKKRRRYECVQVAVARLWTTYLCISPKKKKKETCELIIKFQIQFFFFLPKIEDKWNSWIILAWQGISNLTCSEIISPNIKHMQALTCMLTDEVNLISIAMKLCHLQVPFLLFRIERGQVNNFSFYSFVQGSIQAYFCFLGTFTWISLQSSSGHEYVQGNGTSVWLMTQKFLGMTTLTSPLSLHPDQLLFDLHLSSLCDRLQ